MKVTKGEVYAWMQNLNNQQLQDLLWEACMMLPYQQMVSLEARIRRTSKENEPRPKAATAASVKQRMKEAPPGVDPKEHAFQVAEHQARIFLEHAWNGVYTKDAGFESVISREDYLHWDVQVRAILKGIQGIGPESPSFRQAVDLTIELYELFCFSNEYKLLRKKQTFHFLNTRQDTFLEELLGKIQQAYPREEAISRMVEVTAYLGPDLWDTDAIFLSRILIGSLKTEENRKLALKAATQLLKDEEKNPKSYYRACKDQEKDQRFQNRHLSILYTVTGMLQSSLSREELEQQVREALTEVEQPAYHLHMFLFHTQKAETWKLIYEIGVSMGIPTNTEDQEKYQKLTAGR